MLIGNLTTLHYKNIASKIDTVIIPTGSHEAHGMHCPLGTDNIIPDRMCQDLENTIGADILIAPAVNYGYVPMLAEFDGTITMPAETLISLYSEIGRGFVRWGAKYIVFMNGHGGNIPMLSVACDRIAEAGGTAMTISWWATYSRDILEVCESQGHAGEDETSAILGINPSLVDNSRLGRHNKKAFCLPLAGPGQVSTRYPRAMNGDAAKASREKGELLFDLLLKKNIEYITRLRKGDITDPIV
jgi:creatinine amidohydrolase